MSGTGGTGGEELHRVLARQLRRAGVDADTPPDADRWRRLLTAVSSVYAEHDRSRYVLERAMRISSEEMRELHEVLRSRALLDAMTGLANRAGTLEGLERALEEARRTGGRLAGMFLDLDGFKAVNDRFGHATGDELLVAVAGRLRARCRPADVVGRLGGDEFVVVRSPAGGTGEVRAAAQRVADALAAPFQLSVGEVRVSASVGVALGAARERTTSDFVRASDDAMYAAKAAGENRVGVRDLDADG